jgi:hypothetical protein
LITVTHKIVLKPIHTVFVGTVIRADAAHCVAISGLKCILQQSTSCTSVRSYQIKVGSNPSHYNSLGSIPAISFQWAVSPSGPAAASERAGGRGRAGGCRSARAKVSRCRSDADCLPLLLNSIKLLWCCCCCCRDAGASAGAGAGMRRVRVRWDANVGPGPGGGHGAGVRRRAGGGGPRPAW